MITGENGILKRATDAKQTTERSEAKEQARIDIMAWITDKTANHQDASLDDEKVKEILSDNKSYVKEAKASSFITTKGEYEIPYSELYTATNSTVDTVDATKVAEINLKIGTVVDAFSPLSLEWQVYYADENETFLISKNAYLNTFEIPTNISSVDDMDDAVYLTKWNSKWIEKSPDFSATNAKRSLYICNVVNNSSLNLSNINYATYGPTLELLIASLNKSQNANLSISDTDMTSSGLKPSEWSGKDMISAYLSDSSLCNGVYSGNYYLGNPSRDGSGGSMLSVMFGGLRGTYIGSGDMKADIRLVVSIPTSKISLDGDTVTVLP